MSDVLNTSVKMNDYASKTLKNINQNLEKLISSFDVLAKALNENKRAHIANSKAISVAERSMQHQRKAANQARNSLKQYGDQAMKAKGKFSLLGDSVQGLAKRFIALSTLKTVTSEVDNFANTQARLNTMNDGLQTTSELYKKIYQSAQRSRAPIDGVSATVAKLGIVAKDAFRNNDEIVAFTEIFNKAAVVSGSSAAERSNAMYQLSQGMASGRLQGDELRSVRENAPMMFKAIQKELETQFGKGFDFEKIAREGLITPDVIKRAAFKSAKDINTAFDKMPMTFGSFATQALNKIRFVAQDVFAYIVKIINRPDVKNAINTVANAASKSIMFVWEIVKVLGKAIVGVIGVIKKIAPVIKPLVVAFGTLYAITKGYILLMKGWAMLVGVWKGLCFAFAVAKFILGGATSFATKATLYQTMAQLGLNKAQMVGLIITGKILLIILLVIGAIWGVIQVINYCCGTSISVCGVIFGAVCTLAAGVANIGMGVWNFILSLLDNMIDPFIGIAEFIYNCFNGGFTGWMGVVQNAFGQLVSGLLAILKPLLEVWDMVFDTNAVAKVTGWQNTAKGWGKTEKAANFETGHLKKKFGASKELRFGYSDAWNYGYDKGKAFGENPLGALNSMFGKNIPGIPSDAEIDAMAGKIGDPLSFGTDKSDDLAKALGDNTAALNDNTASNDKEDDYSLLRDVMAQRAINRVGNSGGTVKIDMVNNNSLSSKLDIKSFLEQLAKTMEEAASTAAKGIHN